jgi:N-acetylneuraminic acid mutarotase
MLSLLLLVDDADGKCNNWELVDQIGDIPPGREGHSLIAVNTNVYLLGGVDSDNANNCMNDLHVLYTGSHKWCKVDMSGDIPLAQSSTYVLTNDGRIIAFGGVLNGKACNNIAIMDIESLVWVCPETTGDKPRSRCDHGSAVLGNKMFIFGGSGGEDLWLNDLTYLDLDIMQWTVVESTANSPCPRDYLSLLSIDTPAVQMLIVYGGFTGLRDDRCLGDSHSISVGQSLLSHIH